MGSRATENTSEYSMRVLGGNLSPKVMRILDQMNEDLEKSRSILTADASMIRFLDRGEDLKEYSFAYGALWLNDFPVISGIRSFHFEYRDGSGNRLMRIENDVSSIETVAYTLHITTHDSDVITSSKIKISALQIDKIKENDERLLMKTIDI